MTQDETLHLLALCLENQRALIREVLSLTKDKPGPETSAILAAFEKASLETRLDTETAFNEEPLSKSAPSSDVKSVEIGGMEFEFPSDSPLSKLK